ncbi:rhodanese-like domain-containing protein [Marinomonas rhizomae]|uniref:Rhodanese-related sulfurtransferase n=2 Tax=Marinomonas rhizomae TaxID=491948 RepID=A0A366J3Z2_9GAMM|nr:rhodanese-like domain-containing protein [Marinomonas rhizomae]RBP81069.1 rhodanese-related sulfurtransferase [Marinomonas rhizomae]RNF72230.1 rhodanese-like domain-containing protein [Marinomonas rhizomae]
MGLTIMMNQLIEFSINHWEMVAVFLAILATLLFVESKGGAQGLTPSAATNLMNSEDAVVVDIRPEKEFSTGHITGALNIPATKMKDNLNRLEKHKDAPIIIVCKSGVTSGPSAKDLKKAGFGKVYKLQGGIAEWQSSNLPLVKG